MVVVAPSMIPRKSGERQKNDKRDAASLAVLHRGGLLTAVWVPHTAHEAMRDLIRARLAAVRAVRAARQQLSAFLLRPRASLSCRPDSLDEGASGVAGRPVLRS